MLVNILKNIGIDIAKNNNHVTIHFYPTKEPGYIVSSRSFYVTDGMDIKRHIAKTIYEMILDFFYAVEHNKAVHVSTGEPIENIRNEFVKRGVIFEC